MLSQYFDGTYPITRNEYEYFKDLEKNWVTEGDQTFKIEFLAYTWSYTPNKGWYTADKGWLQLGLITFDKNTDVVKLEGPVIDGDNNNSLEEIRFIKKSINQNNFMRNTGYNKSIFEKLPKELFLCIRDNDTFSFLAYDNNKPTIIVGTKGLANDNKDDDNNIYFNFNNIRLIRTTGTMVSSALRNAANTLIPSNSKKGGKSRRNKKSNKRKQTKKSLKTRRRK